MAESDLKFIETYLRDKFSRPFMRRLRYLYIGLERCEDLYVLSDTKDSDFKYCEPLQATGLVKIHNQDHLLQLKTWFSAYGIDGSRPALFYLGQLLTMLNKVTVQLPLHFDRDQNDVVTAVLGDGPIELIARPVDAYFVLTKLQQYVDKYSSVFFAATTPVYDLVLDDPEKITRPITVELPCQEIYTAGILDRLCQNCKLVLLPGLDMLTIKALVQKDQPYTTGIKLWADSAPRCLNYGGFYQDDDVSLSVVRDNIFIFPRIKKES